jgi:hypothetical protein
MRCGRVGFQSHPHFAATDIARISNNTFTDPTIGNFAVYYTDDVDGIQFPGDPVIYADSVGSLAALNCADLYSSGGFQVTDCDGNDFMAQVCNGGYGDTDDTYFYSVALPYTGGTEGCPGGSKKKQRRAKKNAKKN